ncbi:fasciclin domain-containing protein [Mangrovibacterium diazotrophicum]|uniref:Fasciclin domain-containing protein n=1 Tax=Mangrovibacterium diazotrophicum TaxID=1261403 RepID=A0A419VYW9_9BACT|nr:fasciclin domain-containing protein [Mangrovibacterium diazotrophicum]RKD88260.1 fasciclin domain-containing protein [Mangrovibacterium diazotrophicum]
MKSIIGVSFVILLFAFGCSDDYYADGGVLDDNVGELGVSTMEYLQENAAQFDTLVSLIEICGLEDEVNASGNTFLAPRDYSIHNYFELIFADLDEWPATLNDIDADEMAKISVILQNYILPSQEILREDLTTQYSYATTLTGNSARFNLQQDDYLGNVNQGAQHIVFSLDVSGDSQYQSVTVVSSDLKSTNGVVHVLDSDTHIFGFN